MSQTILVPNQPLYCRVSSDPDNMDVPHDERISAHSTEDEMEMKRCPTPLPDDEFLSSPNRKRILLPQTRDPPIDDAIHQPIAIKADEDDGIVETNSRHPLIEYENDNMDSFLTHLHNDSSSSSFSALVEDITEIELPTKSNAVATIWNHDPIEQDTHELLDEFGIPISITIFRSHSGDRLQQEHSAFIIEAQNSSSSTLDPDDEGQGEVHTECSDKEISESIPMNMEQAFMSDGHTNGTNHTSPGSPGYYDSDDVRGELENPAVIQKVFTDSLDVIGQVYDRDHYQPSIIATDEDLYDETLVPATETYINSDLGVTMEDECSSVFNSSDKSEEPLSEILEHAHAVEPQKPYDGGTEEVTIHGDKQIQQTKPDDHNRVNSHDVYPNIVNTGREIWKKLQETHDPAIHEDAKNIILSEDDDMLHVAIGPELDGEPNYIDKIIGMDFLLDNGTMIRFDDNFIPTVVQRSNDVDPMDDSRKKPGKTTAGLDVDEALCDNMHTLTSTYNHTLKSDSDPMNSRDSETNARDVLSKKQKKPIGSTNRSTPILADAKGSVLARISLKSMITKKWKEIYWVMFNHSCLLIFRSKEDADFWSMHPNDKNRDILIKFQINFQKDLVARTGVRAYKLTEIKSKQYDKRSEPLFQFKIERWTDMSAQVSAAFASASKTELLALYQAIETCL